MILRGSGWTFIQCAAVIICRLLTKNENVIENYKNQIHINDLHTNTATTEDLLRGADVSQSDHRRILVLGCFLSVGNARLRGPATIAGLSLCICLTKEATLLVGTQWGWVITHGHRAKIWIAHYICIGAEGFAFTEVQIAITWDVKVLRATCVRVLGIEEVWDC